MNDSKHADRLGYLDALRGWAILGVIILHVSHRFPNLPPVIDHVTHAGARGVQLFFVVSALTLLTSWHKRADGTLAFYTRRFFRIAPMFWMGIGLFLLLNGQAETYWTPDGVKTWQVLADVFFVNAWHPNSINAVVPGAWSISVEVSFYALFPWFVRHINTLGRSVTAFAGSIIIYFVLNKIVDVVGPSLFAHPPEYLMTAFKFHWLVCQLPIFFVGFCVYYSIDYVEALSAPQARKLLSATVFAIAAYTLRHEVSFIEQALSFVPDHIMYGSLFGLLALSLSVSRGSWLSNPAIRYLGTISFSAYIWHSFCLCVFDAVVGSNYAVSSVSGSAAAVTYFILYLALIMAGTIVLADATYHGIEQPFVRLSASIANRRRMDQLKPA